MSLSRIWVLEMQNTVGTEEMEKRGTVLGLGLTTLFPHEENDAG